jgi:hypothetical protein
MRLETLSRVAGLGLAALGPCLPCLGQSPGGAVDLRTTWIVGKRYVYRSS